MSHLMKRKGNKINKKAIGPASLRRLPVIGILYY